MEKGKRKLKKSRNQHSCHTGIQCHNNESHSQSLLTLPPPWRKAKCHSQSLLTLQQHSLFPSLQSLPPLSIGMPLFHHLCTKNTLLLIPSIPQQLITFIKYDTIFFTYLVMLTTLLHPQKFKIRLDH